MHSQILAQYTRGMTSRDIANAFKEFYDAEVSSSLIEVTNAANELIIRGQNRPLDSLYPILDIN